MKIITAMKDKIAVLIVILSLVTLSCGGTYSAWAQEIRPATGGVGDTIQEIFPDPNFAQVVATKVAGGNVDAILTQEMVTNCLVLDAEFSDITDITGIEVLSSLVSLDLSTNQLTSLPESIGSLTNLSELNLFNNELTSVPESIGNLSNLQYLFLSSNKITQIPDSIGELSLLFHLNVSDNQLTDIPESIGGLSSLEVLALSENQVTDIPDSIGNLANLYYLVLATNQLTDIPESIGNLSHLEWLDLTGNQVTSLPENIGDLSNLLYLDLGNNLLPSDYADILNTVGFAFTVDYKDQRQLMLKGGLSPFIIRGASDFNTIDLLNTVKLNDNKRVSPSHQFVLENYINENNNPVDINEYIKNGVVQKSGHIFAQVRATGTGLFPNTGTRAITFDTIELNFLLPTLSFDLNGGTGTLPETQEIVEGTTGIPVGDPIREGYSFTGWNTLQNGSGTTWILGTTLMPANDVVLYAQWAENVEPINPVTPINPGEPKNNISPKTGDATDLLGFSILLLGSLSLIGRLVNKKTKKKIT